MTQIITSPENPARFSKLFVLAVLYLCFANVVYSQVGKCQYKYTDVEELATGITVLKSTKQAVNGVTCSSLITAQVDVLYEYSYKDGNKEWMRVYYDGEIRSETPYKDGKKEGIERYYDKNGKVGIETPFKNDKLEGTLRYYHYNSGKLATEIPYREGKREGIEKGYYESGKLERETQYKNGNREGYAQYYTETGLLLWKILFKNDEPISGACGNGRPLTNAELINRENGHDISCTPQK